MAPGASICWEGRLLDPGEEHATLPSENEERQRAGKGPPSGQGFTPRDEACASDVRELDSRHHIKAKPPTPAREAPKRREALENG